MKIDWLGKPQKHDYSAALSYLSLTMDAASAKAVVAKLKDAEMTAFAAKNIFRASDCRCSASAIVTSKKT